MQSIDRSDIAIVDFQFCHGNHKSIFMKELAFICGTSIVPNHFLFRPPFNIKELTNEACRTNVYCKNFVNGLDWEDGDVDYNEVESVLMPLDEYKYIFVVGRDKKQFLQKYLTTNIINLEDKIKLRTALCINVL